MSSWCQKRKAAKGAWFCVCRDLSRAVTHTESLCSIKGFCCDVCKGKQENRIIIQLILFRREMWDVENNSHTPQKLKAHFTACHLPESRVFNGYFPICFCYWEPFVVVLGCDSSSPAWFMAACCGKSTASLFVYFGGLVLCPSPESTAKGRALKWGDFLEGLTYFRHFRGAFRVLVVPFEAFIVKMLNYNIEPPCWSFCLSVLQKNIVETRLFNLDWLETELLPPPSSTYSPPYYFFPFLSNFSLIPSAGRS